jgi:hypothetical protein
MGETQLNGEFYVQIVDTTELLPKNEEHVIIITFDTGTARTYINGRLAETRTGITTNIPMNQLGGFDTGINDCFYDGDIYNVRIYNRALSPQEVKQLNDEWSGYSLKDGIVLDMDFREGDGTITHDKSGYNNHGTFKGVGEPAWSATGGVTFDGNDDIITINNDISLYTTDDGLTVSIKVNGNSAKEEEATGWYGGVRRSGNWILGWEGWNDGWAFGVYSAVGVWNSGVEYPDSYIVPGEDVIVTGVYDGDRYIWLYYNGRLVSSDDYGEGWGYKNTSDVVIGHVSGDSFDGRFEKVRIYNRALSPQEVRRLYEEWA